MSPYTPPSCSFSLMLGTIITWTIVISVACFAIGALIGLLFA